jgi:hypothetical protein
MTEVFNHIFRPMDLVTRLRAAGSFGEKKGHLLEGVAK